MERYLDTSTLPKRNEKQVDWKKSIGCKLPFKYGDINGYIEIKDYIIKDNIHNKLLIDVDGKEGEIAISRLLSVSIGHFLGKYTSDFKYDVGYIFGKDNNKMQIISCYKDEYKMYHAKCLKCGYEKDISESHVSANYGCPVCSNTIIVSGINDMHTTHPKLANMLYNSDDGYKYSAHTSHKLTWKCQICGSKTHPICPDEIIRNGLSCKKCGDGYSYPNKFIFNLLTELGIDFVPEKSFDWSKNKRYDFYLPYYNYIIEAHGIQHYQKDSYFANFSDIYNNDIYKQKIALENGIKEYIVIDCRYSEAEYIFKNICNSDLIDIIDITKVDANKIDTMCQKSILKSAADLYKKNFDSSAISKILKISHSSVLTLLKKADNLGLVKYDKNKYKKEVMQRARYTWYQNNAKPIRCIDNGCVFGTYTLVEQNSEHIFGKKILVSKISYSIIKNKKNIWI